MRAVTAVTRPTVIRSMLVLWALFAAAPTAPATGVAAEAARRPNIVMIVADDMGFSDIGPFGGEIRTPTLDALAKRGVRFTDFHTATSCSPTRSMLFSGTDNHIAGVGNMGEMLAPNQKGKPGYEGYMNKQVVSFVNLLRDGGYHTYMTGKWHLGKQPAFIPRARGFERDFSMMEGEASMFPDMVGITASEPKTPYTEDGKYLAKLPKEFKYATEFYVDKMISYIEANHQDGKPFFAYLAHQAVHAPYHLPNDYWLRKYEGKYDIGWDALRKQRLARMKEMGILPANANLADRMWFVPIWDDLAPAAKVVVARKMALYASMAENMDYHTGRLIDYLKQIGEYDNTLFIFLSDNGAEGNDIAKVVASTPGTRDFLFYARNYSQTHPNAWGRPGSEVTYGPGWAQVSGTPFRDYKGFSTEGGIRTPLIIAGAGVERQGNINHSLLHVMDLAPTILELAGVTVPQTYEGRPVQQLQGKSLAPVLAGKTESVRTEDDWLGWEVWGNRAIRKGKWKIVNEAEPWGTEKWELYNLAEDLAEKNDLAAKEPEKLKELVALWDEYAKRNNVILPDLTVWDGMEERMPPRVKVDDAWPPLKFKRPFVPPPELVKD